MKKFALTLICSLFALVMFAQDKIVKMDGTEILCKVKEIGTTEIKYTKADNPDGPVYVIEKSEVRKIVFENGTVEIIEHNDMSVMPDKNLRHYKRAITTRPFAPLLGFVCVGYQQAITPTRALVAEIGFIGPGVGSIMEHATGGYFRVGYRLKRTPEIVTKDMEWGYNLGGFYVQPEVAISTFSRDYTVYNSTTYMSSTAHGQFTSGAFMIAIGRQMIVGDRFTFDLGAGVGYAFTDGPDNSMTEYFDLPNMYYSHSAGGERLPIAYKFTFSMGYLIK